MAVNFSFFHIVLTHYQNKISVKLSYRVCRENDYNFCTVNSTAAVIIFSAYPLFLIYLKESYSNLILRKKFGMWENLLKFSHCGEKESKHFYEFCKIVLLQIYFAFTEAIAQRMAGRIVSNFCEVNKAQQIEKLKGLLVRP